VDADDRSLHAGAGARDRGCAVGGEPQEPAAHRGRCGGDRADRGRCGEQAVALGVFIVVATLGPGVPVAVYFALGDRAKPLLDELKLWLGDHNAAIMAVLCLVIGAKLIGDGISGLG
jgi:Sap, sulfolipid-1-addressing protein